MFPANQDIFCVGFKPNYLTAVFFVVLYLLYFNFNKLNK